MKLYIAGPWKHRHQVRDAADKFIAAGHTITEKWWEHSNVDIHEAGAAIKLRKQSLLDVKGVYNADYFIFLNLAYSEGKCVELGMALSEGIPILAIGRPGLNVFHYHPSVKWVETVEEAIARLNSSRT